MSYANFKPIIWSKHIQHDLPKFTVFKQDCNYEFKGEVGRGKTVKILGVGRPTIGDYSGADIGTPETVADASIMLNIDKAKYFNFMVDDVDDAQATDGLMSALMEEATRGMAETVDSFLAREIALNAGTISASTSANTADEIKAAIDAGLIALWDKGVKTTDKVTIYLPAWAYSIFEDKVTQLKTDNDKLIADGVLGTYRGARIKMSNNIYNDGTDDYVIIKTSKAYAFADGIEETEAYRPQGLFSDAVKGLHTFGGKMVRPKECYVAKVHNS